MSSSLHDVVIRFGCDIEYTAPGLASILKKILVTYYECRGLHFPRKVNHLAISCLLSNHFLTFNTKSHPALTPGLKSNLKVQFDVGHIPLRDTVVEETFPLFPLNNVQEFSAAGSVFRAGGYREMFQKMKDLSHLQLDNLDISPVLDILSSSNRGSSQEVTKTTSIHAHVHR